MKLFLTLACLIGLTFAQDFQCVGVEDGTRIPGESCLTFFECFGGAASLITCENRQSFNVQTGQCEENLQCFDDVTPPFVVSCDGAPNRSLIPSPDSCSEYYQCLNGEAFRVTCPRGLYFSPERLTCLPPSEANCVITPPTPEPTPPTPPTEVSCEGLPNRSLIPSPTSCSEYYQCLNGEAFRVTCPRGLYFSPERLTCLPPSEANCVITPPTPEPTPPTPPTEVSCEGLPNRSLIPSPTSCSEYYQCLNGEAFRVTCPRGLYFSPERLTCLPPSEANCIVTPPPTPPTTDTPLPTPLPTPPPPTISCEDVENFSFVASPISCVNYYQCIDGNPFLLSCPLNRFFDESRQDCVTAEESDCEIVQSFMLSESEQSCDDVDDFWFIRHPASCNHYFQCISGFPFLMECPRGLYFDERIQSCNYPFYVDCVLTPSTETPPTTPTPVDPSCDDRENFATIPHHSSCALFFQCINGAPFLSSCPVGRYFNEWSGFCDDSDNVDCGDRTRRPTTTTQAPIIDEQCRGVDEGRFVRNVFSCLSYYECLEGRAFPRFCDDGLWFDEDLQRCGPPSEVDCPITTTTAPSTIPTAPTLAPVCEGLNEVYVGHPFYCERFYYCVNGVGYEGTCQPNMWFDRTALECRPSDEVDCSLQTMPTTTEIITTTDNSPLALCRAAANNTYVMHSMACGEYFVCINGEPHGRMCQENLWFNLNQQRCAPASQTWCELDEIVCYGVEAGRTIRAPASCGDYVTCINGVPYAGRCINNFWFNEETNNCEHRDSVECDLDVPTVSPRGPCDGARDFSLVGSETSCSEFFVCYANEIFDTLECPENQNFDVNTQVCGDFECSL